MVTRTYVMNAINLTNGERQNYALQIVNGRKDNHISQQLLADTIHCHRQQVSMAEHGKYLREDFYMRVLDGIEIVKRQRIIAQLQAQIAVHQDKGEVDKDAEKKRRATSLNAAIKAIESRNPRMHQAQKRA